MSQVIEVNAGTSAYPVFVGRMEDEAVAGVAGDARFVVTDENVWGHWAGELGSDRPTYTLPAGEEHKTLGAFAAAQSWLATSAADRSSLVVAIGGGVVTDLAGFIAGTYMRGIRYVSVATSLLAMIDAAVGGKTGVDLPEGKNLVGVFHHPLAVWCDPRFLTTLPERHIRNGMAEAIKYGAAVDSSVLALLDDEHEQLSRGAMGAYERLIAACVRAKATVVAEDPQEESGRRAVLNFGHTIGHAIETATSYRALLHGEAVMIGMIVEAKIGERMGATAPEVGASLAVQAARWSLPTRLPDASLAEAVITAMSRDKKANRGSVAMALPERIGVCRLVHDVSVDLAREVLLG